MDSLGIETLGVKPHNISSRNEKRGEVHPSAIDTNVTVPNQLPCLGPGTRKAQAVNKVIQSALQTDEKVFSFDSAVALCMLECFLELTLQHAVYAFEFLFFPKLKIILRKFTPGLSMLSRWITTPLNGALVSVASLPFQEKLDPFPPANSTHRTRVSRHRFLP
jgi:hypothetical protein